MFKNRKGLLKSYTYDLFLNQAKFKEGIFEIEGNTVKIILSAYSLQDSLLFHNAVLLQHKEIFRYKGEPVFKVKRECYQNLKFIDRCSGNFLFNKIRKLKN